MRSDTYDTLRAIGGLVGFLGIAFWAGSSLYESCVKKTTTLENVKIISSKESVTRDPQTDYEIHSCYVHLDKYPHSLETDCDLEEGDKLKSITLEHRLVSSPKVIAYVKD